MTGLNLVNVGKVLKSKQIKNPKGEIQWGSLL